MNKVFISFLIFIAFILPSVSALEIELSPAYSNLDGNVSDKLCDDFSINSDRDGIMLIINKWAKTPESRSLKDYTLSGEDFNLKVISPEKISIFADKKENIEVCFIGKKAGNFYGAVLFESENGYASIGSWIELNIKEKQRKSFISLTGEVIGTGNMYYILTGISSVLLILLLFLLLKLRKKKGLPESLINLLNPN